MKIAYLGRYNPSEELTGPEKVAKRIFKKSVEQNEAVFIEYYFDGSVYGIRKKLLGKEIIDYSNGLKIYRIGLLKMISFLFNFKPDLIQIITFERFSILAYLYKAFSKVKIFYNVHGVAVYENENFKNVSASLKIKDSLCEKIFLKFSDKLLFLSDFQLGIAKKYYTIKKNQLEFINNGIDEEFHCQNRSVSTSNTPSLVFIGDSDRKDKDFNFLYSSLSMINTDCKLFLIGKFDKSIYKTVAGNVEIVNVSKMNKSELVNFLSNKDIFVSSSFYDTFSIAAAECMSVGLVPIVTNHTGISGLIKNNDNGFVVRHGDVNELAGKINLLLENPELREKISEGARKIYVELNWDKVYSSYEKIYKDLS